jgi:hypothetical protein
VIELRHEFNRPLAVTFVDFKAAFDSVDRERMYAALESIGIPGKLTRLMRALYDGSLSMVRSGKETSEAFEVETGVKQGALLSPVIFITVLDCILRIALDDLPGVKVATGFKITDLDFADDIALLAGSTADMQSMMDSLDHVAASFGLQISAEKTKVMFNRACQPTPICLRGTPLAVVDKFCYLGSVISMDGDGSPEVMSRIAKAENAFTMLNASLWSNHHISLRTKLKVYYASVRPVLFYACETWPLKAANISRLQAFEFRCWRRILNITYLDRITNAEVVDRVAPKYLCSIEIMRRRLNYLGHVLRRGQSFLPKICLLQKPGASWKRPVGGTRTTWQRTVFKDLSSLKLQRVYPRWREDWKLITEDLAKDRRQWNLLVEQASGAGHPV